METQTRNSPETASLAGPEKSPRMILKPGTDKSRKKLLVLRSFTIICPYYGYFESKLQFKREH